MDQRSSLRADEDESDEQYVVVVEWTKILQHNLAKVIDMMLG